MDASRAVPSSRLKKVSPAPLSPSFPLSHLPDARAACAHSPTSRRISSVLENDQADGAAVDAMRRVLSSIDVRGRVIIGEGEKDEAPMLYCGEEVRPS